MRIADRAEENYMPMSPHNVCSPVGTMACVHLGAATPNFDLLEYHALEVDWWDDLLVRDEPLIEDGRIAVPEAPGLGSNSTRPSSKSTCSREPTGSEAGRRRSGPGRRNSHRLATPASRPPETMVIYLCDR